MGQGMEVGSRKKKNLYRKILRPFFHYFFTFYGIDVKLTQNFETISLEKNVLKSWLKLCTIILSS